MKNEEVLSQIKELIELQNKGLKAEIKANHDMTNLQLSEIIKRQDRTNGHVADNAKNIQLINRQTRFVRWCNENPPLAIILLLILFFGVVFLVEVIGLESVIRML